MSLGRLIAVVGPSGAGKDSVMAGIHSAMPRLHVVRRTITRAPELGGEDFDPVSRPQFEALVEDGTFALHWQAHGLHYGIPATVHDQLGAGTDCLVNLSRTSVARAAELFPRLLILNVTANPYTLAHRLAARARETDAEIAKRIAQADTPLPEALEAIHLANDGPLSETIAHAVTRLRRAGV